MLLRSDSRLECLGSVSPVLATSRCSTSPVQRPESDEQLILVCPLPSRRAKLQRWTCSDGGSCTQELPLDRPGLLGEVRLPSIGLDNNVSDIFVG